MTVLRVAIALVLLAALGACATPLRRAAGSMCGEATWLPSGETGTAEAGAAAAAALERRRPYLAGEIYHRLDPAPLVVFHPDPASIPPTIGEIPAFAAGPEPRVEYVVSVRPAAHETGLYVAVRYDVPEGDLPAYEEAALAFASLVFRAFAEELERAGTNAGITWKEVRIGGEE